MAYMDVRLVQLLGSFTSTSSEYALARLECAMHLTDLPAPPLIDPLSEPSEAALRTEWPAIERQLDSALAFAKLIEKDRAMTYREDAACRNLDRVLKELDQYARAIRWVLTVTDREDAT